MPFSPDLSDLAHCDDADVPLAESALRIALLEYPGLDPAPSMREIERLAARAREVAAGDDAESLLAAVTKVLFAEAGYTGNGDAYFDPRNSFLNDVIVRKTGIPISLSVLFMEVARRLGLDVRGVGFPGHFLVGWFDRADATYIDAFNRGARLTREECASLLPSEGELDVSFFEPVTHRQILLRMLTNLKIIYAQAKDYRRAVAAIDRILQISPDAITEVRDRGLVRMQAGQPHLALPDLERYIDAVPPSADRDVVVTAVGAARRAIAQYN